ncbi:MAG: hydrogenase expression/formation protein HypE [Kiritimatiellaeota bacterium]|nr:hydrogenase expression/formation protein HypE [Kiritimatiellota bacterium]
MDDSDMILLAHGGGGLLTKELIEQVILPPLRNPVLELLDDGACVTAPGPNLVITTDSYVVSPLFFPGGDIGRLAVCGTVNDLAMQGATPLWLTLAFIIEEGLPVAELRCVLESVRTAAAEAEVTIVAGDTKVVERGKGSGLFINTAGVGLRIEGTEVAAANARPGDAVIVTGTLGDHGVAVMSRREGIEFETKLVSDVAPLADLAASVLEFGADVHCLRDPTRGGLTAALCDIAQASNVCIRVREDALPVREAVAGACNLLGLDPLNVANEGKAVIVCDPNRTAAIVDRLRRRPLGENAALIGKVDAAPPARVLLETRIGGERILQPPTGEDLPRIC